MATIGKNLNAARALLDAGELVAIPTETVYGLGAKALDPAAVAKIFAAKNRPSFDPLIVHQASAEAVFRYVREVPPAARLLAERCWPGPLTLVLPKAATVPDLVTAGLETVAVRVPDHPLTLELLASLAYPLAAPSANPFGFVSPVTAEHVNDQLGDRLDYILDGGPCRVGLESTIVRCAGETVTVLRKGGLTVEDIAAIVGREVGLRTHGSSRPEAPGMLSRHYSPGVQLLLVEEWAQAGELPPGAAVLTFGPVELPPTTLRYNLSSKGDPTEAARNLFPLLRRAAREKPPLLVARLLPERGLGRAINDRLRRAAAR